MSRRPATTAVFSRPRVGCVNGHWPVSAPAHGSASGTITNHMTAPGIRFVDGPRWPAADPSAHRIHHAPGSPRTATWPQGWSGDRGRSQRGPSWRRAARRSARCAVSSFPCAGWWSSAKAERTTHQCYSGEEWVTDDGPELFAVGPIDGTTLMNDQRHLGTLLIVNRGAMFDRRRCYMNKSPSAPHVLDIPPRRSRNGRAVARSGPVGAGMTVCILDEPRHAPHPRRPPGPGSG